MNSLIQSNSDDKNCNSRKKLAPVRIELTTVVV